MYYSIVYVIKLGFFIRKDVDMKYIIPMAVGAVIGYITNWFAIKMLFRPHYEKRIFGIRLPFTPGLIPKEKSRIARSTGHTIGEYLLSPEIIIESVSNNGNDKKFEKWVKKNILKLKESNLSIRDLFSNLEEGKFEKTLDGIENSIVKFVELEVEKWSSGPGNYGENQEHNEKQIDLEDQVVQQNHHEQNNGKMAIKELLPGDVIIKIREYIDNHNEDIVEVLRYSFRTPSIEFKIKSSITEIVSQNVSKIITRFVSEEIIVDKIYKIMENYLYNPRSNGDINFALNISIDKLLENEIPMDKVYEGVSNVIYHNIRDFVDKPISEILGNVEEEMVDKIANFSRLSFEWFVKNKLPDIVELFNISKIIEDEINAFDVAFAEELILEIASKELKAITWLGALLGGIMGILMPFLSALSV